MILPVETNWERANSRPDDESKDPSREGKEYENKKIQLQVNIKCRELLHWGGDLARVT